ncbi:eae-like domain protein [Citrobacter braakii]|nr:eae-like domain protein [Citrobacter braakii]WFW85012.1 eae-like domain protein [Citrobacter braakii]
MQQMEENSPRVAALQYCLTQVAEKVEEAEKLNAELESRCAALAAENAGLKAVCEDRRTFIMNGVQLGYIQVPTVETDPALETIRVAVSPQEPTQATDAFLAEVRAQGVEMYAENLTRKADESGKIKNHAHAYLAANFAAQLRQGEAQ